MEPVQRRGEMKAQHWKPRPWLCIKLKSPYLLNVENRGKSLENPHRRKQKLFPHVQIEGIA